MNEPTKRTKVIDLNGQKYQLRKMDARSASYIAFTAASVILPVAGNKDGVSIKDLEPALTSLPRAKFNELQTMLLNTVSRLKEISGQSLPEPVLKSDGSFVDSDLEYDFGVVLRLTIEALIFNVGGFFGGAGFPQIMKESRR